LLFLADEDFVIVDELFLGACVALEALSDLELQRREPARGDGVVVAVPASAQAALMP
jgi:hypothetical protein